MKRDHNRPTDDELIDQGIAEAREARADGLLFDTTARLIASHHHWGESSALHAFVSTGEINLEGLNAELLVSIESSNQEQKHRWHEKLNLLGYYFVTRGDREAVDGWDKSTS